MNAPYSASPPASYHPRYRSEADAAWRSLYRVGGVAALLAVLVALLDIAVSFGGGDMEPGTLTAVDWFGLLQDNPLLGLRNLGILNTATTTVAVPLYFALYAAHRRVNPAYAALAALLFCMGTTIYVANNVALPMLTLSEQYGAATTQPERSLLAAAGQAMLAREDLTAGTFIGFFLTEVGGIGMAIVMLRGRVFSRPAAWAGILGLGFLLPFNILVAFVPGTMAVAMVLAMVGGLSSMAWYLLIARRLFQLGQDIEREERS